MLDLKNALLHLITTADSPYSDSSDRMQALQGVVESARAADKPDLDTALTQLSDLISSLDDEIIASMIAVGAGAIVEFGGNPTIAFQAILEQASKIADKSNQFARYCLAEGVFDASDFDAEIQVSANQHPQEAQAWRLLNKIHLPIIAMASRSQVARAQLRQNDALCSAMADLEPYHVGASWVYKMCSVLDDELIVVLHPEQERGYRIKISGIADNFQLHILLADALIGDTSSGWLSGEKPAPDTVNAMRDENVGEKLIAKGVFDLLNYSGLQENGKLKTADSEHWIWNEGIPSDIQRFRSERVILLRSASYERTWNAQRLFSGMKGDLQVVDQLTPQQYTEYITRIVEFNYDSD